MILIEVCRSAAELLKIKHGAFGEQTLTKHKKPER